MNSLIKSEIAALFVGRKLGSGVARKVYVCLQDIEAVIKIEKKGQSFQNIHEWELWNELKETDAAKWLAPCIDISPCGTVLLQRRVKPLRREEMPAKMPAFLTDFKVANFGMYEGRVVCCDYGATIMKGSITRLKKADWWE